MPRCRAKTKAGKPCSMPPLAGKDLCWSHAGGEVAKQREQSRRAGGLQRGIQLARRSRPVGKLLSPTNRVEANEALVTVAQAVWKGDLDARSANAIVGAFAALKELPQGMPGVRFGDEVVVEIDAPPDPEEVVELTADEERRKAGLPAYVPRTPVR